MLPQTLRAAGRTVDVVARLPHALRRRSRPAGEGRTRRHRDLHQLEHGAGLRHNVADAPRLLLRKYVAAIGPITAKTALALGIRVDAIADEFTIEGLLGVLEAVVPA